MTRQYLWACFFTWQEKGQRGLRDFSFSEYISREQWGVKSLLWNKRVEIWRQKKNHSGIKKKRAEWMQLWYDGFLPFINKGGSQLNKWMEMIFWPFTNLGKNILMKSISIFCVFITYFSPQEDFCGSTMKAFYFLRECDSIAGNAMEPKSCNGKRPLKTTQYRLFGKTWNQGQ